MKMMREKESEKDHTISELMKISLELKERLDQEEVQAETMKHVVTDKSVSEIEETVQNFPETLEKIKQATKPCDTFDEALQQARAIKIKP